MIDAQDAEVVTEDGLIYTYTTHTALQTGFSKESESENNSV